ncbi:uncharacterized protein G2W53_008005 [Senna tora]|uniref:Secreted protein n=1 Tax=Senna tora TaxID=362788 RepID=A0A834X7T2_9FABA|nr:uncharacterized protein G2W53_008005 [Senna tora]
MLSLACALFVFPAISVMVCIPHHHVFSRCGDSRRGGTQGRSPGESSPPFFVSSDSRAFSFDSPMAQGPSSMAIMLSILGRYPTCGFTFGVLRKRCSAAGGLMLSTTFLLLLSGSLPRAW